MHGDLKTTFIQKVLRQYGEEMTRAMPATMQRLKVHKTGEGAKSIGYQVLQWAGGGKVTISFKEYLRFVDMGVGRGHPLGGLSEKKVTLMAQNKTGMVQVKDRTFKPRKIYSKVAYGKLGWMYGKLLYGYTEETIAMLKGELRGEN